MEVRRDIGQRVRDMCDAIEYRLAGFRHQFALARELEPAGTASAQPSADMIFETLERHAEGGLLLTGSLGGPADAAGLDDNMEGAKQIPVEVAGEVAAGRRPDRGALRLARLFIGHRFGPPRFDRSWLGA